jgi:hypothetical protein
MAIDITWSQQIAFTTRAVEADCRFDGLRSPRPRYRNATPAAVPPGAPDDCIGPAER